MKEFFGESLYRLYRVILKLVLSIVPTLSMIVVFIKQLINFNFMVEGILSQLISLSVHLIIAGVQSVIFCLIWTTIVFSLLKLCSFPVDNIDIDSLEDNLVKKQKKSRMISGSDCFFNMIGILFLVWLFCFQSQWIASYQVIDGKFQMIEPLFNESVLRTYHPLIFMIYGGGLLYYGCKLMLGKWSVKLLILQLVYKVAACSLFCAMLLNQSLFNERFFTTLFSFSNLNWTIDWYVFSRVLMIISLFSLIVDLSQGWMDYRQY